MNALIIIDMQPTYFKTTSLAAQRDPLIEHINRLIENHHRNADPIINVRTVHSQDKSTWTLNMLDDDQGFSFDGSEEAAALSGLHIDGAIDIIKTRDDAFHGTTLRDILRRRDVTHVTLAGVSAHSCIFHTAATAYAHNYLVTLPVDAIGDEDEGQKRWAIDYLQREYRQQVT